LQSRGHLIAFDPAPGGRPQGARALLRRRGGGSPSPVLTVGTLRLDTAARRVHRGEEEITLTAKEFAVLEQLAVRAGQVVSKADILEHVWDFAYDGDPNIVEVYV
ncbi:winged helix-turn-helix domain-containing protein, partial [Streptomyces exfoliatus]|uniref:winged helix-turn-helix domain-containing protein n=1 Tax=Streptomyces exfoliatus TaxID=1905 RepID=UPI0004C9882E